MLFGLIGSFNRSRRTLISECLFLLIFLFLFFSVAVYMSEWERSKSKPPEPAEQPEGAEGAEAGTAAQPEASKSGEGDGGEKAGEEAVASPGQPPVSVGVTYELCAGLVDKPNLTLEEIARQEVLEECGYDVPVTKLRKITSYRHAH